MPDQSFPKLTVYFDGSCPLCRQEISFYRERRGAEGIQWVDVSAVISGEVTAGLSCRQAMAKFHVLRPDGVLIAGGHAFAELWRVLPGFKWAGWLFCQPGFRQLINLGYDAFLPIRPTVQRLAGYRG